MIDVTRPMEDRVRAFYHRVRWLRGLGYDAPYIDQISRVIDEFGDLGVIEARENPNGPDDPFPRTMYVESRPTLKTTDEILHHAHEERANLRPVPSFTMVRFGGLGRR